MAYLEVRSVWKSFGQQPVLRDINFSLNQGHVLCLLGPSGCGKTTMLRILAGLIRQDTGEVWLEGRELTPIPTHKRAIGMVFQRWALFPHMTVADNVAFGLKMQGVPASERSTRVLRALDLVRLAEYVKRRPHELSGGQQQRVALARTLVTNPKLVLFDEPLSNLDAKLRGELRRELRQLQQELGFTAVYVTHDQSEALTLGDEVAVMQTGEIVESGVPRSIFARPRTMYVAEFLGIDNVLRGRVTNVEDDRIRFALEAGPTVSVDARSVPASAREGLRRVGIRGEAIDLAPIDARDEGSEAMLAGVIRSIEYQAARSRFAVALNTSGEEVHAYQPLTSELKEGQAVRVRCDWTAAFGIEDSGKAEFAGV